MKFKLALAAGVCAVAVAGSASATILIDADPPFPPNPDENVILNQGTGATVTGHTNQSNTIIQFTGNETLNIPSGGQARVDSTDTSFTFLDIRAANAALGFTALELNIDALADGGIQFTAYDQANTPFVFNQTLDANGSNFFNFTTADDQLIRRLVLSSNVQLADVGQVRVTLGTIPGGPGGHGEVPEPATWAMMLVGFFGAGTALRSARFRRRYA